MFDGQHDRSRRRRGTRRVDLHQMREGDWPGGGYGYRALGAFQSAGTLWLEHPDPMDGASADDRRALLRGGSRWGQTRDIGIDAPNRLTRTGSELSQPAGHHEGQRDDRYRRGALL